MYAAVAKNRFRVVVDANGKNAKDRACATARQSSSLRALTAAVRRAIRSPVTLIILLPLLVFGRALQPNRIFSAADNLFLGYPWYSLDPTEQPYNSLLGDVTFDFQPWQIFASREIRSGRFPLWNPHAYAGAPLLGNAQSALLFPFSALTYILPIRVAFGLEPILKITTAGLSMYWLLRVLALQQLPALAGGLAFMFNGFLIVWLGWPVSNVGIWLPLLVALAERLRQTGTWRYAEWLALVICIQFLGGHPEVSFYVLVVTTYYALYRARGPNPVRFLLQFIVAGVLGGLFAAVQLLPLFDYLSQSAVFFHRKGVILPTLPLRAIIALWIPNYFGSPISRNFWGPVNYNEISGSVGLIPWVLVPCALLGAWSKRESRFFLGLAIFSGAAIYSVPPLPWVLSTLPGFSMAANSRLLLVLAFSMAALSGIGMDVLFNAPARVPPRVIIIGVSVTFLVLVAISVGYLIADYDEILGKGLSLFIAFQWGTFFLLLAAATILTVRALQLGACSVYLELVLWQWSC